MHPLLNKYFAGTITDSEKAVLFRELEDNTALKEEFARSQNALALSGISNKENDQQWAAAKMDELLHTSRKRSIRRAYLPILKYAAVAILISSLWLLFQNPAKEPDNPSYTYIEVPKGQTIHIILPDGTETWLSSRTRLNIPTLFNQKERTVELDGEALFHVTRNEEMPFIVKTQQYNIQVTGTHFNVFAYAKSPLFRTDLIEGSVFIFNEDNAGKTVSLQPEETVYLKDGQLIKTTSTFSRSRYIMNGIYYFENTSFQDIADCLELWYNVKIHLQKEQIASHVFSGKFRQSDHIELILQAIKETGKFNYKLINDFEIEIY
ncbi:MAG: FecR family protein [Tannerellaceae bacterium]|jgi:ferric-dicitrate binding protein FerR (iron transport regulator)|nr:FecR family protein [Tannerellaceae bacterium]